VWGVPASPPTLPEVVRQHASTRSSAPSFICERTVWTWRESWSRMCRLARQLHALGVSRGDRIAWIGQNCHRFFEAMLATNMVGGVFVPVNWRCSPAELAFLLGDCTPAVVFWQDATVGDTVARARAQWGDAESAYWIRLDGAGEDSDLERMVASAEGGAVSLESYADDPCVMLYTAAFEGVPNGALLSHRAWLMQTLVAAIVQETSPQTRFLCSAPMFHAGGMRHALAAVVAGGVNVIVRRPDPDELCNAVERYRCTDAYLQRPTINEMVELNSSRKFDLSSLALPPSFEPWNDMITTVDRRYDYGYGQTECAGVVTLIDRADRGLGTAGRPSPIVEIRVIDAAGGPVAPGGEGELLVRGPILMNGYFDRTALNERRRRGDWHCTSDKVRFEADGTVSFLGSLHRLIKSANENIYPAEVERCLRMCPGVAEVVVFGRADAVWGQSVVALIVRSADNAGVTADQIVAHCRENIASYKKPREIRFVDSLPHCVSGDLDYMAAERLYQSLSEG
jgi:acyl-CoA synthetase (AMP-forming)/AMP-acid ligase II